MSLQLQGPQMAEQIDPPYKRTALTWKSGRRACRLRIRWAHFARYSTASMLTTMLRLRPRAGGVNGGIAVPLFAYGGPS